MDGASQEFVKNCGTRQIQICRASGYFTSAICFLSHGMNSGRIAAAAANVTATVMNSLYGPSTSMYSAAEPAILFPNALATKNQTPIIIAPKRTGARRVTRVNPTGDKQS